MKGKNLKEKFLKFKQRYSDVNLKFKNLSQQNQWKFKIAVCLKSLLYGWLCIIIYGVMSVIVVILGMRPPYQWIVNSIFFVLSTILLYMVLIFYPCKFMNPTRMIKMIENIEKSKK